MFIGLLKNKNIYVIKDLEENHLFLYKI